MLISTDTGAHARTSVVRRCRSPGGDRVPVRGPHPERVGSDLVSFRLWWRVGGGCLCKKGSQFLLRVPTTPHPPHTPHTLPTMAAALSSTASISGACRLAPPARAGQVSVEWTEREREERAKTRPALASLHRASRGGEVAKPDGRAHQPRRLRHQDVPPSCLGAGDARRRITTRRRPPPRDLRRPRQPHTHARTWPISRPSHSTPLSRTPTQTPRTLVISASQMVR